MKRRMALGSLLLSLTLLLGCQAQTIEKVGVPPDQDYGLSAENVSNGELAERGAWNVQQIDEVELEAVAEWDQLQTAHFNQGQVWVESSVMQQGNTALRQIGQLTEQTVEETSSLRLPQDSYYAYSPDGTKLLYEQQEGEDLALYLYHTDTGETELIFTGHNFSAVADEQGWSVHFLCEWADNGESFVFWPLCLGINDIEAWGIFGELAYELLYIYRYEAGEVQAMDIPYEILDMYAYEASNLPMLAIDETGENLFIYANLEQELGLSAYIRWGSMESETLWLRDYLEDTQSYFGGVGSEPLFSSGLLYLHLEALGILVLDVEQASTYAFYPFNDPIQAFTVYDSVLVVAQPALPMGIDVTAYILNAGGETPILFYHSSSYESVITHMEMEEDSGSRLLIEEVNYSGELYKKLVLLSFTS